MVVYHSKIVKFRNSLRHDRRVVTLRYGCLKFTDFNPVSDVLTRPTNVTGLAYSAYDKRT